MKHGLQITISKRAEISKGYFSKILHGKQKPSWDVACRLGDITRIEPALWMDGKTEEIKRQLELLHF